MTMIHDDKRNSESLTLRLADGEVIYCGPENNLLRHIVDRFFASFRLETEFDSSWIPLVLYGESLCGKSLAAHGLANAWKQQYPKQSTVVLTASDLARSFRRTELADNMDQFTSQLRKASLLVIDDVQQLAGKVTADSWLVNLLDYRTRYRTPVIVTCNSTIAKTKLSARLRSRLAGGLSVCISLPYASTRKEVILKSAQSFDLTLVEADVDQLVEITSGKPICGVHSVVASLASNNQSIEPGEAGLDFAEDGDALIQKLIRTTARRFGVKVADLKGPSRRKNTVLARAIAMFLIREITPLSLAEVGHYFRNRDHTTVRHACEKIKNQIVKDEPIQEAVSSICNSLDFRLPSAWFDMLNGKCA
jgi:chromosomal replication initiator protein